MDMIQLIGTALGREPKLNMLPMQPGDVPVTYADITHAQEKLGYQPTTPIAAGIPNFVSWYRTYHKV